MIWLGFVLVSLCWLVIVVATITTVHDWLQTHRSKDAAETWLGKLVAQGSITRMR